MWKSKGVRKSPNLHDFIYGWPLFGPFWFEAFLKVAILEGWILRLLSRHIFPITKKCTGIITNKSVITISNMWMVLSHLWYSFDSAILFLFWWKGSDPASKIQINQLGNVSLFQQLKWLFSFTYNDYPFQGYKNIQLFVHSCTNIC